VQRIAGTVDLCRDLPKRQLPLDTEERSLIRAGGHVALQNIDRIVIERKVSGFHAIILLSWQSAMGVSRHPRRPDSA